MTKPLAHGMIEATRLTNAGRLKEATTLIQRLLRGGRHGTEPAEDGVASTAIMLPPPTVDLVAREETGFDAADVPGRSAPDNADSVEMDIEPRLQGPLGGVFDLFHAGRPARSMHRALSRSLPSPTEVVPSVGTFVAESFSDQAGSRAYKLYVPRRYAEEPRPLIVMLHGCTQSADDFAAGTRMNFAAEENNCFVVYPEQAFAANSSKCWNWFKSGDQQRGGGEPALIAGITRQVMTDHNIDPRRIYIAGLSAGGATAAIVAEAYPDLYVAVGVHSGLACGVARDLQSAFAAMRGQHPAPSPKSVGEAGEFIQLPTIVFHGDRDATVHPRNGVEVVTRAGAGGEYQTAIERGSVTAGHTYTRSVQSDANGRRMIEQWEIHGADHAWSGGSPSGSFTDPKGPDATKEMLRFFLEHVRAPDNSHGM